MTSFLYVCHQTPLKHRDASVAVRDTWEVVEELDFPRMAKLTLPDIAEGEDLYGDLYYHVTKSLCC